MGRKSKDVTPRENASRGRASEKSAEMLPKILSLAVRKGSLQTQRVKCGKANCKCAHGALHDGYHYFFTRLAGRQFKVYVRRADVAVVEAVIAERAKRRSQWRTEYAQARGFLRRLMSEAVGLGMKI